MEIKKENIERQIQVSVAKLEIDFENQKMNVKVNVLTFENEIEDISKRRFVMLVASNATLVDKKTGAKDFEMEVKDMLTSKTIKKGLTSSDVCGQYDYYLNIIENTTFTKDQIFEKVLETAKKENKF